MHRSGGSAIRPDEDAEIPRRNRTENRDGGAQLSFRLHFLTRTSLVVACALFAGGCRQDMHNQPKYIPYRSSAFFPDGLSERQQVAGTVARDQLDQGSYF